MKRYSNVTIALREEDVVELQKLKKLRKGELTNIEVFRAGVKDLTTRHPKKLF